jgi:hypothetical protein
MRGEASSASAVIGRAASVSTSAGSSAGLSRPISVRAVAQLADLVGAGRVDLQHDVGRPGVADGGAGTGVRGVGEARAISGPGAHDDVVAEAGQLGHCVRRGRTRFSPGRVSAAIPMRKGGLRFASGCRPTATRSMSTTDDTRMISRPARRLTGQSDKSLRAQRRNHYAMCSQWPPEPRRTPTNFPSRHRADGPLSHKSGPKSRARRPVGPRWTAVRAGRRRPATARARSPRARGPPAGTPTVPRTGDPAGSPPYAPG